MNNHDLIELFVLKSACARIAVDDALGVNRPNTSRKDDKIESAVAPFVSQFPESTRINADMMSDYYKIFYMLENDTRRLIDEVMIEAHGRDWWDSKAPNSAKEECKLNQQREREAAVTFRSENPLDYVSFGQLGEIIRFNWGLFGGVLSNQKALGRVMFALNLLRGPIAHCGLLAEDEIDRLKLAVKDWFRLLEGPKD
jgi:Swt1-like HEPN